MLNDQRVRVVKSNDGVLLSVDRLSPMVSYMKVRQTGRLFSGLLSDTILASLLTLAIYWPLRELVLPFWFLPVGILILKLINSQRVEEDNMLEESFLLAGDLGVQVKTRFKNGKESAVFIQKDDVKDIRVTLGLHRFTFTHYLVVLKRLIGEIIVFKNVRPPVEILEAACQEARDVWNVSTMDKNDNNPIN